jgi:hypothetical protein
VPWFGRLGAPLDARDREIAQRYAASLGLEAVDVVPGWREAEAVARDPGSGERWWTLEDGERRRLMRETGGRIGEAMLLDTLTSAVEGEADATFERALGAGADEALARVASGAALMALHNRSLALVAGCGPGHLFMQKYALFAAGRWPLGSRGTRLTLF